MSGEKTEAPSPKRLRKAREDGNVAKSKDFSTGFLFLAGAAIIGKTSSSGVDQVKLFTMRCLQVGSESSRRLDHLTLEIAKEGAILILMVVMPLLGRCSVSRWSWASRRRAGSSRRRRSRSSSTS